MQEKRRVPFRSNDDDRFLVAHLGGEEQRCEELRIDDESNLLLNAALHGTNHERRKRDAKAHAPVPTLRLQSSCLQSQLRQTTSSTNSNLTAIQHVL